MSAHNENLWRELMFARQAAARANSDLLATQARQPEVDRVTSSLQELLPTVPARVGTLIKESQ